jgi:FkbM family methyltransferase
MILFIKSGFNNIIRTLKVIRGKDFFFRWQTSIPTVTLGNSNASFTICPDFINASSIVYSVGVGTDISFDLELIKKFNLKIFAFDPTPKSIDWIKGQFLPDNFSFHPFGLAKEGGVIDLFLPENNNHVSGSIISHHSDSSIKVEMKSLLQLMNLLGHTKIDVLKMDIEGAEYGVIDHILEKNIEISQLLVEFHHRMPGISKELTKNALQKLNAGGFRVFHISPSGEEYSLIK